MSNSSGQFEKKAGNPLAGIVGRALAGLARHPVLTTGAGTAAAWDIIDDLNNPRQGALSHIPLVPIKQDGGRYAFDRRRFVSNFLSGGSGALGGVLAPKAFASKLPNASGKMVAVPMSQKVPALTGFLTSTTLTPLGKAALESYNIESASGDALNRAQTALAEEQLRQLRQPKTPQVNTPAPPAEKPQAPVINVTTPEPKAPVVNVTTPDKMTVTPGGSVEIKSNPMMWLGGALGLGALGLGGAALYRYYTAKDRGQGAKIQYRMEGKKGDPWSEALVDVPIRTPRLSPKVKETLESGLKRQVSKNIKYMSMKRDPNTGKRISYEDWQRLYGEEDSDSSTKTPDENYVSKLDKKYEKAASFGILADTYMKKQAADRSWAEGSGAALNTLAAIAAGALGGKMVADKTGKDGLKGALLGGALGATPALFGSLLGHAMGERTPAAQLRHDDKGAGAEFIFPGNATYNSARRNPRAIQLLNPSLQEAYKDDDEEGDDFGDDED